MSAQADEPVANAGLPEGELDAVLIVEAALFSAGKPVSLDEIAENTGLSRKVVPKALAALQKRYSQVATSLEIARAGDKWAMQVQTRYAPSTVKLAPMEIPIKLLKTLALIAYHQPLLQSEVKEMVGEKAYDHIRELKERGLIKKRAHERSYIITTSDRFPEYFGIPAADREGIKTFLAGKVGLELPKTDKKGNKKLSTFPSGKTPPAPQTAASESEAPAEAADVEGDAAAGSDGTAGAAAPADPAPASPDAPPRDGAQDAREPADERSPEGASAP